MNVSEIMETDIFTLSPEDSISKALYLMAEKSIHQIPVIEEDSKYLGMIFAKQILNSSAQASSKVKSFVVKTPTVGPDYDVEKTAQLVVGSGNRALPVLIKEKLVGIVSETDIVSTADFGRAMVDEIMSGAIVIEETTLLSEALAKMRRYNISRLPVISTKGMLRGTLNILHICQIIANPRERTNKSAAISGLIASIKDVKVKDLMKEAVSAQPGTKLNGIAGHFKKNEEVIVVGEGRPMGIVTPKDALELVLPKKSNAAVIQTAHFEDEKDRIDVQQQVERFLKKIQGRLEDVQSIVVYADKHKSRKYSLRIRLITSKGVIIAKAVGYDPISAAKELIDKLDSRLKEQHSQRVETRQHRGLARRV